MIWIALAAQLSAPVPTNLTKWAAPDDVPVQLIPEGPNLAVGFRIVVDPAGKPQDCHIDSSSGIKNLDSYTCKLVMRRARFQPATDELGRPMFGAYKSFLSWWVGEKGPPPPAPFAGDLDLLVNALPAGTTSPITVRVMFAVDPDGRASSCLSAKQQPEPTAALVKLACEQVSQQIKPLPVTDARDVPVASVQDAQVRFSTK